MYKNIIKSLCFALLLSVLFIKPEYNAAGMVDQIEKINDVVSDVIQKREPGTEINLPLIASKVQEKTHDLGLDLNFEVAQNKYEADFNISGMCNVTGGEVCDVAINKDAAGAHYVSTAFNPGNDGCLTNGENGNLCVAKPLELVFVMNGKEVRPGCEGDFKSGGSNICKVINLPSLHQKVNGPCGYYALFNLLKIHNGEITPAQLLDRAAFEAVYPVWRANCSNVEALSNYDLKALLEKCTPGLCKDNVLISCCDVNCNKYEDLGGFKYGDENTIATRIKDFRENGRTQYLIVGTDEKTDCIPGIKLKWDDFNGRRSCTPNHWIAMKIEWAGKPGYSPVIITVSDSSGPYDNRFTATIHFYYYIFAKKDIDYSLIDSSQNNNYDFAAAEIAAFQDAQQTVKSEEQAVAGNDWENYEIAQVEDAAANYESDYDFAAAEIAAYQSSQIEDTAVNYVNDYDNYENSYGYDAATYAY